MAGRLRFASWHAPSREIRAHPRRTLLMSTARNIAARRQNRPSWHARPSWKSQHRLVSERGPLLGATRCGGPHMGVPVQRSARFHDGSQSGERFCRPWVPVRYCLFFHPTTHSAPVFASSHCFLPRRRPRTTSRWPTCFRSLPFSFLSSSALPPHSRLRSHGLSLAQPALSHTLPLWLTPVPALLFLLCNALQQARMRLWMDSAALMDR